MLVRGVEFADERRFTFNDFFDDLKRSNYFHIKLVIGYTKDRIRCHNQVSLLAVHPSLSPKLTIFL